MSELINKLDATTIPVMPKEYRKYQAMNLDDAYEQGWNDLQRCIEILPSAETELEGLKTVADKFGYRLVKKPEKVKLLPWRCTAGECADERSEE